MNEKAMDAEYDDNSYRVMVAVGFSIGITVIAIILRLLARKIQHVPLGADDFTVVAGAVGFDLRFQLCLC